MKKLEFGFGAAVTIILTNSNKFLGIHFMPPEGDIWWYRSNDESEGYCNTETIAFKNITERKRRSKKSDQR